MRSFPPWMYIGLSDRHLKPGLLPEQREYLPFRQMRPCPLAVLGAPEQPLGLRRRALPFRGSPEGAVDFLVRDGYRLGPGDRVQKQVALDSPLGHGPVLVAEALLLFGGPFPAFPS